MNFKAIMSTSITNSLSTENVRTLFLNSFIFRVPLLCRDAHHLAHLPIKLTKPRFLMIWSQFESFWEGTLYLYLFIYRNCAHKWTKLCLCIHLYIKNTFSCMSGWWADHMLVPFIHSFFMLACLWNNKAWNEKGVTSLNLKVL